MAFGRQLHQAEGQFRTMESKVRIPQSKVWEFRTPQTKVRNCNSNAPYVKHPEKVAHHPDRILDVRVKWRQLVGIPTRVECWRRRIPDVRISVRVKWQQPDGIPEQDPILLAFRICLWQRTSKLRFFMFLSSSLLCHGFQRTLLNLGLLWDPSGATPSGFPKRARGAREHHTRTISSSGHAALANITPGRFPQAGHAALANIFSIRRQALDVKHPKKVARHPDRIPDVRVKWRQPVGIPTRVECRRRRIPDVGISVRVKWRQSDGIPEQDPILLAFRICLWKRTSKLRFFMFLSSSLLCHGFQRTLLNLGLLW
ncbi:hypothetical protein VitviT2T_005307 [Vitis vinifera]|uniref:Uncharacterized protein n=1 Tax=Vitis vinifera TaxID=29760 RepID=A0ABY9BSV5_VITVI|nr:hypothetical protein VitviT2T_005307 [Vitis vinifera]